MSYLGPTPLPVPIGGSGASSLTNHGVVLGQGVSPVAVTSAGVAGQVLTSNGPAADPSFQATSSSLPISCGFMCWQNASTGFVTGNGALYSLTKTAGNITTGFDTGTNITFPGNVLTFTAPRTGKYCFQLTILVSTAPATYLDGRPAYAAILPSTANRTFVSSYIQNAPVSAPNQLQSLSMNVSALIDMAQGDTCTFAVAVGGGGVDTAVIGLAGTQESYVYGYLVSEPAGGSTPVSFLGYLGSPLLNWTGNATGGVIPFDTANFGDPSYFQTSAGAGQGLFTAPKAGKYLFNAGTCVQNLLNTHVEMHTWFVVNGVSYIFSQGENPFVISTPTGTRLNATAIIQLNKGDTVGSATTVAGGTKTVSVLGTTLQLGATWFSGTLLSEMYAGLAWSEQGAPTTIVGNTGSLVTAAITLTLPATPVVGETCSFILDHAGPLVIQSNAGQRIRFGTVQSAVAGTATSSAYGDSIELVYRGTNSTWLATTAIGTWNIV